MTSLTNDEINTRYTMNAKSLFSNALHDLSVLAKEHSRFLEAQRLQPYADLIYGQIQKSIVPASLLLLLKEQIRGTDSMGKCSVSLWAFNAVTWHQTLEEKKARGADYEGMSDRALQHLLTDNRWDHRVGTKQMWDRHNPYWDDEYPEDNYEWKLFSVRVLRVFRNTDLLKRINVLFGSQFEVKLVCTPPELYTQEGVDGFTVNRYEVRLFYLGRDLPVTKMKELLAAAKKYSTHKDYVLKEGEDLFLE